MNKIKLQKTFDEIKSAANLDYAITNADELGDCYSCCSYELCIRYGRDSRGIFTKHWLKGMNAGRPWKELDEVLVAHDVTETQYDKIIEILKKNGYSATPEVYDPTKSIIICEVES